MCPTTYRLMVVIEPDGEGFHAFCPALKGLHVSGATEEEALVNVRDAATAYLRSLIRHGDPIPLICQIAGMHRSPGQASSPDRARAWKTWYLTLHENPTQRMETTQEHHCR